MSDEPNIGGASSFRHTKDSTLTSFLDLGLSEPITRALVDEQYATPTPIQAQTIPQVLAARDVVGIAQTGTGKTAAFALPILNHLAASGGRPQPRSCRVLVLSPTRELSAQIVDSFQTYGRYLRPRVALAIGGVPINRQIRALTNGVDVLVATPGRLLDLMQSRAVQLDRVEIFVLDEADRMLDMGFIHDIRRIVTKLPSKRQTLFFSATMPREIADLASHMLRDPVRVAVTPAATTVERIEQRVIHVDRAGKPACSRRCCGRSRSSACWSSPAPSAAPTRSFARWPRPALPPKRSTATSRRTSASACWQLSAPGTCARWWPPISPRAASTSTASATSINYDLPNIPESYVHRIGRTARAGADGIAISFCEAEERPFLRDIEKLIRMSIPAGEHAQRPALSSPAARASRQRLTPGAATAQTATQWPAPRPDRAQTRRQPPSSPR